MNKNLIAYGIKVATNNSAGAENGPDYFNFKDCVWDFRIINIEAIMQKHGSDDSYSQDMRGSFFVIAPITYFNDGICRVRSAEARIRLL